jgi:hypothetical protein
MINPGNVGRWSRLWIDAQDAFGFTPSSWMSASLLSFAVAAAVTALIGALSRSRASDAGNAESA